MQRKGMFPSLSPTKGEWVQASSPKISGTVWVDDTLLTKRRLVKMSGYFVKSFIFLYFYETKTKSINYKKQKKKKKMIIKNTSQYAPDPLNRPSKYKPPPPGGLVLGNCPEIQKKTKKTVNFLPRIRLAQSILKRKFPSVHKGPVRN